MVRKGSEPFPSVFSAISGSRLAFLIDRRPRTWVHGQNTDNDTTSRPGLAGPETGWNGYHREMRATMLQAARAKTGRGRVIRHG
jgi:hypothetical protein